MPTAFQLGNAPIPLQSAVEFLHDPCDMTFRYTAQVSALAWPSAGAWYSASYHSRDLTAD